MKVIVEFKYDCEIDHVVEYLKQSIRLDILNSVEDETTELYVEFFEKIQLEIWFVKFLKGEFRWTRKSSTGQKEKI